MATFEAISASTSELVLLYRDGENGTKLTPTTLKHWISQARVGEGVTSLPNHQGHTVLARLGEEACELIIKRYSNGEPAGKIAEDYGVARNAILNLLRRNNVVVRRQPLSEELKGALTLDFGHGVSGGYAAIDSVAVALAS